MRYRAVLLHHLTMTTAKWTKKMIVLEVILSVLIQNSVTYYYPYEGCEPTADVDGGASSSGGSMSGCSESVTTDGGKNGGTTRKKGTPPPPPPPHTHTHNSNAHIHTHTHTHTHILSQHTHSCTCIPPSPHTHTHTHTHMHAHTYTDFTCGYFMQVKRERKKILMAQKNYQPSWPNSLKYQRNVTPREGM